MEDELSDHKKKEVEKFDKLIEMIANIDKIVTILSTEFSLLVKKQ